VCGIFTRLENAMSQYEQVQQTAAQIVRAIAPRLPQVGLVLGSGLSAFADALAEPVVIPYSEILGFAPSTVAGHPGRLVAGLSGGVPVLVMQGRVHRYEGHTPEQVVLPVRALGAVGCKKLIVTNAAGGIRDDIDPGEMVLITDHIDMTGSNPLTGPNDERLGPRFPDMSRAYDPELRMLAHAQALAEGLRIKEGVYCAVMGPSYETPAEVRMLRTLGADLVGMSTVPEVIAANHMGARVLGISCVTNRAAGLGGKLSHDEVQETATRVNQVFMALLSRIVSALRD
jgi:purine-nucleoside phosphorylase